MLQKLAIPDRPGDQSALTATPNGAREGKGDRDGTGSRCGKWYVRVHRMCK